MHQLDENVVALDILKQVLYLASKYLGIKKKKEDLLFEQTIQRKLIDLTSSKMREANRIVLHDGRVPLEIFQDIQKIHTMSLGVVKYLGVKV